MVLTVLDKVDNYTEFLTVNELEDELRNLQRKDSIKINQIGKSSGHSILSAKIGNGKKCSGFWLSTPQRANRFSNLLIFDKDNF